MVDMQLGVMPSVGILYEAKFKKISAESVYDLITTDLGRLRKLATFFGIDKADLLGPHGPDWQSHHQLADLNVFYRGMLMQGLSSNRSTIDYHGWGL